MADEWQPDTQGWNREASRAAAIQPRNITIQKKPQTEATEREDNGSCMELKESVNCAIQPTWNPASSSSPVAVQFRSRVSKTSISGQESEWMPTPVKVHGPRLSKKPVFSINRPLCSWRGPTPNFHFALLLLRHHLPWNRTFAMQEFLAGFAEAVPRLQHHQSRMVRARLCLLVPSRARNHELCGVLR
jgi:hypothetical protein